MKDEFGAGMLIVFIALLIAVFGYCIGSIITDNSWKRDCEKLGAHVHDSKVYECKERK